MSLIIDVYDGFGLYMPLGTLFAGLYWAPNYKNKDDLFLIMNGLVVSDYIGGWGLIAHDYRFTGMFLFFGYAK
jgi:hypothetical protein